MINFFRKLTSGILIGLTITALVRFCYKSNTPKNNTTNPNSTKLITLDCLKSLPNNVPIRKDESSKDVETEGDKFEAQGKGQEALNKYTEAHRLYLRELGYATGRALRGDPSASMEINISITLPEFKFKLGRAFAKTDKQKEAITCFTESLNEKIDKPNDASAYLNRAEAYIATGKKAEAIADLRQAANLFKQYNLPQYQKMATNRLRSITP